ncbi:MAG: discoidin domain-containing protein [Gemmatimonadales bacterium]
MPLTIGAATRLDAQRSTPAIVTATVDVSRATASFSPAAALGAGVDGHGRGTLRDIYTPANIRAMRSTGLNRLTYRLRTELGIEAWHWNPRGAWTDASHAQGYWTSDSTSASEIMITHGYRLPRRGNTIDQADNTGYSRLDDGDSASYWKSNPYLDRTIDPDETAPHPQWVIVDLGAVSAVNAIQIAWADPFATDYRVQYWRGEVVDDIDENPAGRWVTFPRGDIRTGAGGIALIGLADGAVRTRFVRLVLTASSHTALAGSRDPRDSAGYAIRELWIGTRSPTGIADLLHHGASRATQSTTYASSTDPWHSVRDLDIDLEQPGFDRVFASGLTNGYPVMIPVPVLFSTPEDGANELRFLAHRNYPVERIELGEEPDGQYVTPEDYAALYLRWASALHRASPNMTLGGPSFQGLDSRVMMAWPDDSAGAPWMTRFLSVLRARGRAADLGFVSFEWYPFDDVCAPPLRSSPPRRAVSRTRCSGSKAREFRRRCRR